MDVIIFSVKFQYLHITTCTSVGSFSAINSVHYSINAIATYIPIVTCHLSYFRHI